MIIKKYTYTFLYLLAFVVLSSCTGNGERSDKVVFNLKGAVKSFTENQYEVVSKSEKWEKGDPLNFGNQRTYFDKDGFYEKRETIDKKGDILENIIVTRENGKIVSEAVYDLEGKKMVDIVVDNKSDDHVTYTTYENDSMKTSMGEMWYEKGKLQKQEIEFFRNGEKQDKIYILFEYDSKGNISAQKQTDDKGSMDIVSRFEYVEFDKNDNWTKRLDYSRSDDGEPARMVTRTFEYYDN